jgi:hypothetical protein
MKQLNKIGAVQKKIDTSMFHAILMTNWSDTDRRGMRL